MPIYEYVCVDCSNIFEYLVLSKDDEIECVCPVCFSKSISKQIGKTTFQLKGDGWAKDNYGLTKK